MTSFFLDDTGRLRTAWRFVIFGIAIAMAMLLAVIPAVAVELLLSAGAEFLQRPLEPDLSRFVVWYSLPVAGLSLAVAAMCRWLLDRRPVWSMGLGRPERRPGSSVWVGLAAGIFPLLLMIGMVWVAGGYELIEVSVAPVTVLLIPALLLMAFQEEIMVRGYLLQNLLDIRRPVFGVLFTSVVFWLVHGLNPHAWASPLVPLNLFGAGVLLALAYITSGNLWFPTALHFGWNFAQGILVGLPVSGQALGGFLNLEPTGQLPDWLTGGDFGPEASVLITLVEIGLIAVFVQMLRKQRKPAEAKEPETEQKND